MVKQKNSKMVQTSEFDDGVHDKLAARVLDLFVQAKSERSTQKVMGKSVKSWIGRLSRAYHKIHEQEELDGRDGMTTYFGLIHSKVNMTQAFIKSKYVAFKSFPFALEPTPIVELPSDLHEKGFKILVGKLLEVLVQQGIPAEALLGNDGMMRGSVVKFLESEAKQSKSSLREEEMKLAKLAADEMTKLIQDQFSESQFEEAMIDFIGNLALYPAAFLAFDYVLKTENKWQGKRFVKSQSVKPVFRAVHPMNAFPSPDFSGDSGSYFIEKMQRTRAEMVGFLNQENNLGYINQAIKDVLKDGYSDWLDVDYSDDLAKRWRYDEAVIDVLKCQMLLSGRDLLNYGVPLNDLGGSEEDVEFQYFNADIEVCCHRVISVRLVQTPHGKRSYFMTSYKRVAGMCWGISPAMMIYDRQLSVNRTHYAMATNVYNSSGPMAEVAVSAFDNPYGIVFKPYSILYTSAEQGRAGQGFVFHEVAPRFNLYFQQLTNEIRLADDECGLPSFLNGNAGLQGAGRTLGGLSMMQDNAIMGLKECFANIDMYVIRPIVAMLRDTNLEDGNDMGIRGDCDVVATGLLGLERELDKARVMAGLVPTMGQFAQQGAIPNEMYSDYVMDMLKSQGVDVSKYAQTNDISGNIGNMIASNLPDRVAGLDGRSLSQM